MTAPRTLAALIALVPLAAMADGRAATGTLAYPQRIALPPDAMVVVQATGADGAVLAETRQPTNGAQVPLPFSLDLPETTGASLRAAIIVGADVAWLSPAVTLADGAGTADLGQVALRPYRAPGLPLRMSCGEVRPAVAVGPAGGRLRIGGRQFDLVQAVSASGAKYAAPSDLGTYFWSKGDTALVSVAGVALPECRMLLPDDAAFVARGHEPGWALTLADGQLRLDRPDEAAATEAPLPAREPTDSGRRLTVPDGGPVVEIGDRLCRDSATGMPHPHAVTVVVAGETLQGCGGAPADLLDAAPLSVTELNGAPLPDGAMIDMRFLPGGRVAGKSACNRYNAGYTIGGEGIAFAGGALTRMACPEPLMSLEQQFHETLGKVSRFDVAEDGAVTFLAGDAPVLTARP